MTAWILVLRGHSALKILSISLQDAAHTDMECGSQCASVLLEISPTCCDDSFIAMLKSKV